jgi:hypothetical protein
MGSELSNGVINIRLSTLDLLVSLLFPKLDILNFYFPPCYYFIIYFYLYYFFTDYSYTLVTLVSFIGSSSFDMSLKLMSKVSSFFYNE